MNIPSEAPQHAGEMFNFRAPAFKQWKVRAERARKKQKMFSDLLPALLREHVTLVHADEQKWIVRATSAQWATRLPYILPNVRAHYGELLGCVLPEPQIQIMPTIPPIVVPRQTRPVLTEKSVQALQSAAESTHDLQLKATLLQLAVNIMPSTPETPN